MFIPTFIFAAQLRFRGSKLRSCHVFQVLDPLMRVLGIVRTAYGRGDAIQMHLNQCWFTLGDTVRNDALGRLLAKFHAEVHQCPPCTPPLHGFRWLSRLLTCSIVPTDTACTGALTADGGDQGTAAGVGDGDSGRT